MPAVFVKPSLSSVETPLIDALRRRALQWVRANARVTRGQWVDVVSVNGLTLDDWVRQLDNHKRLPEVFEEVVFDCYTREALPEGLTDAMLDGATVRALPWVRWTPAKIEAYEAEVILRAKDNQVPAVRYRLMAKAVPSTTQTKPDFLTPAERAKLLGRATYDKKDLLWDDSMDYVRPGFRDATKSTARKVRVMAVERLTAPVQLLPINQVVTI